MLKGTAIGLLSSIQVIHQNEQTIIQKGQYNESRLTLVQNKVLESQSSTDIKELSRFLLTSDFNTEANLGATDEQVKQKISQKIQLEKQSSKDETQAKLIEKKFKIIKKVIKIILVSLIASIFFWILWKSSSWARKTPIQI